MISRKLIWRNWDSYLYLTGRFGYDTIEAMSLATSTELMRRKLLGRCSLHRQQPFPREPTLVEYMCPEIIMQVGVWIFISLEMGAIFQLKHHRKEDVISILLGISLKLIYLLRSYYVFGFKVGTLYDYLIGCGLSSHLGSAAEHAHATASRKTARGTTACHADDPM